MSINTLTIQLVGFNNEQRGIFNSILNLAEPRLHKEWHVVEGEADFWLFPQEPFATDKPSERSLFYTNDPDMTECIFVGDNFLPKLRGCHFHYSGLALSHFFG